MDDSDAEKEYYKGLLASSGSEQEQEYDIEEQRKKLLAGLSKEEGFKMGRQEPEEELDLDNMDWDAMNSDDIGSEELNALEKGVQKKQKDNLKINFTTGFGEDVGKKLI